MILLWGTREHHSFNALHNLNPRAAYRPFPSTAESREMLTGKQESQSGCVSSRRQHPCPTLLRLLLQDWRVHSKHPNLYWFGSQIPSWLCTSAQRQIRAGGEDKEGKEGKGPTSPVHAQKKMSQGEPGQQRNPFLWLNREWAPSMGWGGDK